MNDAERYKLLYGPYRAPRCKMGSVLFCEMRGDVVVKRISEGRIPWPMARRGTHGKFGFILCGDLVKAVQRESATAVCYWWGVTPQTVTRWRKALDVPETNEGTKRLRRDWLPECISESDRDRGLDRAHSPEVYLQKGKCRPWTAEEDALLAALPALEVARRTGRDLTTVYLRRQDLGIRLPRSDSWTPEEDALLRKLSSDEEVAERTGRGLWAVGNRRRKLRILRKSGPKRKNP